MSANGEPALPEGWEWTEPEWHPNTDPTWKAYRMAKHPDGRIGNFESRLPADELNALGSTHNGGSDG